MSNVKQIADGGAMLDHATAQTRMVMLANIVHSLIRTGDLRDEARIHLEELQTCVLEASPRTLTALHEFLPRGRDPWAGLV